MNSSTTIGKNCTKLLWYGDTSCQKSSVKIRKKIISRSSQKLFRKSRYYLIHISRISTSVQNAKLIEMSIDVALRRIKFCRQDTRAFAWQLFNHFKQGLIFQHRSSWPFLFFCLRDSSLSLKRLNQFCAIRSLKAPGLSTSLIPFVVVVVLNPFFFFFCTYWRKWL